MPVPVIVEGPQINTELLARPLEELNCIVTVHSDVLRESGRELNASTQYAGMFDDQVNHPLFKLIHMELFQIILPEYSNPEDRLGEIAGRP